MDGVPTIVLGGITEGQAARTGMRTPPSQVSLFIPSKGPKLLKKVGWFGTYSLGRYDSWEGPLSEENTISVLESILRSFNSWRRSTMARSEEHTSELQSLMSISYAVF